MPPLMPSRAACWIPCGACLASPFAADLLTLLMSRLPPGVSDDLPVLLRIDSPIRVTEVQPNLPVPAARKSPVAAKEDEKLAPDLRVLLAGGGDLSKPRRLEVILATTPEESDRIWRRDLTSARSLRDGSVRSCRWRRRRARCARLAGVTERVGGPASSFRRTALGPGHHSREDRHGRSAAEERRATSARGRPQGQGRASGDHRRRLPRLARAGRQGTAGADACSI